MPPADRTSLPPLSPLESRRLRWNLSALRVQVKLLRLAFLLRKANFNPDQPRVPAGNPDGGQWTKVPGWGGNGNASRLVRLADVINICIAAGISRWREGNFMRYKVTYDCRDGRELVREGFGEPPGLVLDPHQAG
jgi:hypothetical protein